MTKIVAQAKNVPAVTDGAVQGDTVISIPSGTAQLEVETPKLGAAVRSRPQVQETESPAKPIEKPRKWQDRLLPLMASLLIGLTIFFFIATFAQMAYLHWSILQFPAININTSSREPLSASAQTFDEKLSARRLEVLAELEAYLVQRRYHQASVALMSGLWIRYLGFVTGMILALVGASFVLGKLREPITEIASKTSGIDLSLKSASPGIILVVLGVLLMFATIINRDLYEVQDVPAYLSGEAISSTTQASPPEPLPPLGEFEEVTPAAPPTSLSP